MNDIVLAKLDTARQALAEAKTIQETKKILDVAAAAEIYAKRQKLGEEAVQYATSIKIEALRQLGRMLQETERNKGAILRGAKLVPRENNAPTLAEIGIDKKTSKLAQDIARLPDDKIEAVKNRLITLSRAQKEQNQNLRDAIPKEKLNQHKIKLITGDMKSEIPKLGKFDLIIADPPYNVTDWEWDKIGQDFLPNTKEWLSICKNALSQKYHLFWFCSPKYSADIEMLFRKLDMPIKSRIVWHRRNMSMGSDAKDKFIDSWEMILHSGNYELNYPLQWSDNRFDVQTFAVPQTNFEDQKLHPTQKPLALIKWLVEFGSYPEQRILDPFAGSGTTGEAAQGRECFLIEKKVEYANIAKKRLGI
jgi:adenine-specific DNA-methyltransferase